MKSRNSKNLTIKKRNSTKIRQETSNMKLKNQSSAYQSENNIWISQPTNLFTFILPSKKLKDILIEIKEFFFIVVQMIWTFIASMLNAASLLTCQFIRYIGSGLEALWVQNQLYFIGFVILLILLLMPFSHEVLDFLLNIYMSIRNTIIQK